jgi:hypothetical protein
LCAYLDGQHSSRAEVGEWPQKRRVGKCVLAPCRARVCTQSVHMATNAQQQRALQMQACLHGYDGIHDDTCISTQDDTTRHAKKEQLMGQRKARATRTSRTRAPCVSNRPHLFLLCQSGLIQASIQHKFNGGHCDQKTVVKNAGRHGWAWCTCLTSVLAQSNVSHSVGSVQS